MPWSPPEVHPADGFLTHVVDGSDAVDSDRPLVVLLGQVLTASTLDYEQEVKPSVPTFYASSTRESSASVISPL